MTDARDDSVLEIRNSNRIDFSQPTIDVKTVVTAAKNSSVFSFENFLGRIVPGGIVAVISTSCSLTNKQSAERQFFLALRILFL